MDPSERAMAQLRVLEWTTYFSTRTEPVTNKALGDIRLLSAYGRYLEEENTRLELLVPAVQSHSRPGWWDRFLKLVGIQ